MPSDLTPMQQETISRVRGHIEGYAVALSWKSVVHPDKRFGELADAIREDAKALEELTGQEEQ